MGSSRLGTAGRIPSTPARVAGSITAFCFAVSKVRTSAGQLGVRSSRSPGTACPAGSKLKDVEPGSGRGALLNLHNIQGVATPAVTGTSDWTRVEVEFETDAEDVLQVNCLFGGWGLATGQAWFDDVALEQIGQCHPGSN